MLRALTERHSVLTLQKIHGVLDNLVFDPNDLALALAGRAINRMQLAGSLGLSNARESKNEASEVDLGNVVHRDSHAFLIRHSPCHG